MMLGTSPEASFLKCVPRHKPVTPLVRTKFSKETQMCLEGAGCYLQLKVGQGNSSFTSCLSLEELSSVTLWMHKEM